MGMKPIRKKIELECTEINNKDEDIAEAWKKKTWKGQRDLKRSKMWKSSNKINRNGP